MKKSCSLPPAKIEEIIKEDGAYLLNIVITQGPPILELLAREDQALLVRGDPFLVLDLGLDIVDGVGGLDLEGDGLARQGFDEAVGLWVSLV